MDAPESPVRRYRQRLRLTREGLAARCGVSIATVKRWENGYRPRRKTQLEALAKALRLSKAEEASLLALIGT